MQPKSYVCHECETAGKGHKANGSLRSEPLIRVAADANWPLSATRSAFVLIAPSDHEFNLAFG